MLDEEWEEGIDPDTGEPDWVVTGYHWTSVGSDTVYWTGYVSESLNSAIQWRYAGPEQIGTGNYGDVGVGWELLPGASVCTPLYQDIDNPRQELPPADGSEWFVTIVDFPPQ